MESSDECIEEHCHSPIAPPMLEKKKLWMEERDARKLAEKQRRAKFNSEINELAKMVPHGGDGTRRMEKMEVLRLATHGLRLKYIFGKTALAYTTTEVCYQPLTNALLHLIDSFFITLTCNGQIVLISSNVEDILGYSNCDLFGQNILQITHPKDRYLFREQLIPTAFEHLCKEFHLNTSCAQEKNICEDIDETLQNDKRCFTLRLARPCGRFEKQVYELVKIDGCFRRGDSAAAVECGGRTRYPLVSQLIRRSNYPVYDDSTGTSIPHMWQHEALERAALHGVNGNDIVLVAMVRIIRPSKIPNWPLEASRLEYKTRHLIDGRIIDCDHRISLVAGYLSSEVHNLSPFSFMHQDDVRWVVVALRQMYDCNSYFGESYYRLLARDGNFIYLHTKGFMEIDKSTNKVHSFVCINTLLDEPIGSRKVQEMKNKFSVIINAAVPQTKSRQDLPASQNPQQLERIVLYLIENLQKRANDSDCSVKELQESEDINQVGSSTSVLDLIPPEPATVRSSITRSIGVINTRTNSENLTVNANTKDEKVKVISDDVPVKKSRKSRSIRRSTIDNDKTFRQSDIRFINIRRTSPRSTTEKLSICCQFFNENIININAKTNGQLQALTDLGDYPFTVALKRLYRSNEGQPFKYTSTNDALTNGEEQVPILDSTTTGAKAIERPSNDIHQYMSEALQGVRESLDRINKKPNTLNGHSFELSNCFVDELADFITEQREQTVIPNNKADRYKRQLKRYDPSPLDS